MLRLSSIALAATVVAASCDPASPDSLLPSAKGGAGSGAAGAAGRAGRTGQSGAGGGAPEGGAGGPEAAGGGGNAGKVSTAGRDGGGRGGRPNGGSGTAEAGEGGQARGRGDGGMRAGGGSSNRDPGGAGGEAGEQVPTVTCAPPCEVPLARRRYFGDAYDATSRIAVLDFDFGTNSATLTNAQSTISSDAFVVMFTLDDFRVYGYDFRVRGSQWMGEFLYPFEYAPNSMSLRKNFPMTLALYDTTNGDVALVDFSFGDATVAVSAIRRPDCMRATTGACAGGSDCSAIDRGTARATAEGCAAGCSASEPDCVASCVASGEGLSPGCASCYAAFADCVNTYCPKGGPDCPYAGTNCVICETNGQLADRPSCEADFLTCSGLDYMPPGTLSVPPP